MKKRFNLATVAVLMMFVAVTTYMTTYTALRQSINDRLDTMQQVEESNEKIVAARKKILESFVGECDEDMLNDGAVAGMVAALGDRWSAYLSPEQYAELTSSDKSYAGIGISVSLTDSSGLLRVLEVYPGSPAHDAGIQPGDMIAAVNGERVLKVGAEEAKRLITDGEGVTVELLVRREGGEADFNATLRRAAVTRPMVTSEILGKDIGYVNVNSFDTRAGTEFTEAVKRMQEAGIAALVIDMRNNPGGGVDVMKEMLDFLLPKGRLITMRYKDGTEEYRDSDSSAVDLPMAVLINGESYSAAEFFAACMREYEAAVLIGEPTTGKGYAQKDYALPDGSGIHLSVLEYFTPNGLSLAEEGGVKPDIPLTLTESQKERYIFDRSADVQLAAALDYLVKTESGSEDETERETEDEAERETEDE